MIITFLLLFIPEAFSSDGAFRDCIEMARFKADADHLAYVHERAIKEGCDYGLTPVEHFFLSEYTSDGSQDFNEPLRRKDPSMRGCVEGFASMATKLPKYTGLLWRGVRYDEKADKEHAIGNTVTYASFTSTGKGFLKQYVGTHALHIKGHSGVDISKCSEYTKEGEVLFAPGTRFKVVDRKGTDIYLEEVAP